MVELAFLLGSLLLPKEMQTCEESFNEASKGFDGQLLAKDYLLMTHKTLYNYSNSNLNVLFRKSPGFRTLIKISLIKKRQIFSFNDSSTLLDDSIENPAEERLRQAISAPGKAGRTQTTSAADLGAGLRFLSQLTDVYDEAQ